MPKWVESGAFVLALVAGCINAIFLMGLNHQSVSHVSGTASLFGVAVAQGSFALIIHLAGVLLTFLLGAAVSGYLLHNTTFKIGRNYETALALEALLLFLALYLMRDNTYYGHFAASAACGMQNGMVTTYSGTVVRTTHLTGIFTDLGIMIGEFLRGHALDKRKLWLFLLIIAGFISGGIGGALLFTAGKFYALLAPALLCTALAVVYRMFAQVARFNRRAQVRARALRRAESRARIANEHEHESIDS